MLNLSLSQSAWFHFMHWKWVFGPVLANITWGGFSRENSRTFSFFLIFIYLFIYLWLCWVFISVQGLSLVVARGGPLFIAVHGPLTIAASLVVEHRLQTRRLSNCGSRAQLLRGMWDLPRPRLEPVSPALAGRFSTTVPPGKPLEHFHLKKSQRWKNKGSKERRMERRKEGRKKGKDEMPSLLFSQCVIHSHTPILEILRNVYISIQSI